MSASAEHIPTNEESRAATERAFEEHFQGDWIDTLSDADLRDLVRRQWANYMKPSEANLMWKYHEVVDVLTRCADKVCTVYAEKSWPDYLKG